MKRAAYLVHMEPDIVFPPVLYEALVLMLVLADIDEVRIVCCCVVEDHLKRASCRGTVREDYKIAISRFEIGHFFGNSDPGRQQTPRKSKSIPITFPGHLVRLHRFASSARPTHPIALSTLPSTLSSCSASSPNAHPSFHRIMTTNYSTIPVVQTVKLEVDLCVWVVFGEYPWWPARVVDRKKGESKLDPGESVAAPNGRNMMVEWFDEDSSISVLDNKFICEYTTNMHLVRQTGEPLPDIIEACRGANKYLETNKAAIKSQVRRYNKLEPFEEFIKPKDARSKKNSSKDGLPDAGKAPRTEKGKGKSKTRASAANYDDEETPEPPVPRKRNSPSSNPPRKTGQKRGKARSSDRLDDMNDSYRKDSRDSSERREKPAAEGGRKAKRETSGDDSHSENSGHSRRRAQSTSQDRDAEPDRSPSAWHREDFDGRDSRDRDIGIDDYPDMEDRGGTRKRRKYRSADSRRDDSDADGGTEKEYKKRRVHEDNDRRSNGDGGMCEQDDELQRDDSSGSERRETYSKHFSNERERERVEEEELRAPQSPYDDARSYSSQRSLSSRGCHTEKSFTSESTYIEPERDYPVGAVDRKLSRGSPEPSKIDTDIYETVEQRARRLSDPTTKEMNTKFEAFQTALMVYNDEVLEAEYMRFLLEKRLVNAGKKRERLVSMVQELKDVNATPELLKKTKVHLRLNWFVKDLKCRAPVFVQDMLALASHWTTIDGMENPVVMDMEPAADEMKDAIPNSRGTSEKEDTEMKDTDEDKDDGKLAEPQKVDKPEPSDSKEPKGENTKIKEKEKEAEIEKEAEKKKVEMGKEPEKEKDVEMEVKEDKVKERKSENAPTEEVGATAEAQKEAEYSKKDEKEVQPASEIVPNSSEPLEEYRAGAAKSAESKTAERAKNFDPIAAIRSLKICLKKAEGYDEKQIHDMAVLIEQEMRARSDPTDENSYYKTTCIVIKKFKKNPSKVSSLVDQLFRTRKAAQFFD